MLSPLVIRSATQIVPTGTAAGIVRAISPKSTPPSLLLLKAIRDIAALASAAHPTVKRIIKVDSPHRRVVFRIIIAFPSPSIFFNAFLDSSAGNGVSWSVQVRVVPPDEMPAKAAMNGVVGILQERPRNIPAGAIRSSISPSAPFSNSADTCSRMTARVP